MLATEALSCAKSFAKSRWKRVYKRKVTSSGLIRELGAGLELAAIGATGVVTGAEAGSRAAVGGANVLAAASARAASICSPVAGPAIGGGAKTGAKTWRC